MEQRPTGEQQVGRSGPGRPRRRLVAAAAAALLAGGGLIAAAGATASATPAGPSTLDSGQLLLGGQSLTSPGGQFELTMRSDGDLVETSGGALLWSSHTSVPGSHAAVDLDGNFGVYSPTLDAEWSTHTYNHEGDAVTLSPTGTLEVVDGLSTLWSNKVTNTSMVAGQVLLPTWSITSPDGLYQLVMRRDGNLSELLATPQRAVRLWTVGKGGGAAAVMQSDGNFVVYSATHRPVFDSGTSGHHGAHLAVSNAADVQVVGESGQVLWSSESATLRTDVVSIAVSQVGYQDAPKGTYCNQYSAYWGSGGNCPGGARSEQWCADFAAWVWRQAGVPFAYGWGYDELDASAASFYEWAVANGTWHPASSGYVARPGDVAVFGLDRSHTYADHVAVVVTAGRPGADVVNGDWWSSGDGGVVAQWDETTATGSDHISGYASP